MMSARPPRSDIPRTDAYRTATPSAGAPERQPAVNDDGASEEWSAKAPSSLHLLPSMLELEEPNVLATSPSPTPSPKEASVERGEAVQESSTPIAALELDDIDAVFGRILTEPPSPWSEPILEPIAAAADPGVPHLGGVARGTTAHATGQGSLDDVDGLHRAWRGAHQRLDQAIGRYQAARRMLEASAEPSFPRALAQHDEALFELGEACDECAKILARLKAAATS
jgi:hypothetical protein